MLIKYKGRYGDLYNGQNQISKYPLERVIKVSMTTTGASQQFFYQHDVCCSVAKSCPTLCDPMNCSMPGSSVFYCLLEFAQIHVHWVSDLICLILCHPLLLLPSILPSIRVYCNESALCIRWPKYWSFSFNNGLSNEYSRLISFRIDWFDLLAVQGTLKSLFQHYNLKASILWHSAFMVQLSHLYMTTGKTIALIIWTFVSKVMSLLFNMLPRFVIAFLPRIKCLWVSWLPKKIKSDTVSTLSLIFAMKWWDQMPWS